MPTLISASSGPHTGTGDSTSDVVESSTMPSGRSSKIICRFVISLLGRSRNDRSTSFDACTHPAPLATLQSEATNDTRKKSAFPVVPRREDHGRPPSRGEGSGRLRQAIRATQDVREDEFGYASHTAGARPLTLRRARCLKRRDDTRSRARYENNEVAPVLVQVCVESASRDVVRTLPCRAARCPTRR